MPGYPGMMQQPNQGPIQPMAMSQNMQFPQPNMQEFKPYSPSPMMPPLVGRWVSKFDDIKPQDVPMDGSTCFFPQSDGSCIYAMTWSNDGKIVPYRFLPEKNETPTSQTQQSPNIDDLVKGYEVAVSNVIGRLDSFEKRFEEFTDKYSSTATKAQARKKTDKEEDAV